MPTNEHLVLCGAAAFSGHSDATHLNLNLHGSSANVRLEIGDISRRLLANISDIHADLLEIASYIYAADSAIPRGGKYRRAAGCSVAEKAPVRDSGTAAQFVVFGSRSICACRDHQFSFRRRLRV